VILTWTGVAPSRADGTDDHAGLVLRLGDDEEVDQPDRSDAEICTVSGLVVSPSRRASKVAARM